MCAAMVQIVSDDVLVRHHHVVLGKGKAVYELRDFDADVDIVGIKPAVPADSVSHITLDLGPAVGRAVIRTREHDTAVDVEAALTSVALGCASTPASSGIIIVEGYDDETPHPITIVDTNREVLAIVTHRLSSSQN
ncbi:MAG: hypothetical protein U0822_08755 [Anaerolineae bacterium]